MTENIDRQIAKLEAELNGLRRQKLASLEQQVSELAALLGGGTGPVSASPAAEPAVKGGRRRRRKRYQRFSDEEAVAALKEAVAGSGSEGIAGKQASEHSGVSYPRAIKLLDANFKKSGSGKWTRYTMK